jgi:transposase
MFNHYVAVDWAMSNMAIARMTSISNQIKVIETISDIKELKTYLKNLQGSICLTLEESTASQWLYVELREHVDKIIICDPYRNKLLSEGGKNDKIDAVKLVKLLKADLLKEVFHSSDKLIELRKLVSGYDDLISSGVRLKCQRAALFRGVNKDHKKEKMLESPSEKFVLEGIDKQILNYEVEKKRFVAEFKKLKKVHPEIKLISDIPGMGDILATKIVARIVDVNRFPSRNHFYSYCGLIKLDRMSGGKSYGQRSPRYCRTMKGAIKIAVTTSYDGPNSFAEYYQRLINEKKLPPHNARNALARKIAATVYGVLKSKEKYQDTIVRKSYVKNVDL